MILLSPNFDLPDNSDTDADGLTAHEELTKYSTDSDKADTTGDGFRDGFLVLKASTQPPTILLKTTSTLN